MNLNVSCALHSMFLCMPLDYLQLLHTVSSDICPYSIESFPIPCKKEKRQRRLNFEFEINAKRKKNVALRGIGTYRSVRWKKSYVQSHLCKKESKSWLGHNDDDAVDAVY